MLVPVVGLALLSSLIPTASLTAQQPDAGAGGGRFAFAVWLREEADRLFLYVAYAEQSVGTAGPISEGGVGRLACREQTFRGHPYYVCGGRMHTRPIGPSEFEMDPLLDSARLTVKAGGATNTIRWKGLGDAPSPFAHASAWSPCCGHAGADGYRWARATGRVLGTRLGARRSGAAMDQGAGAGTSASLRIKGLPRAGLFLYASPDDVFWHADLWWRPPRPEDARRR